MMYETIIFKNFCENHSKTYYVEDHTTACEFIRQTQLELEGLFDEGTDYAIEWGDDVELDDDVFEALEQVQPRVYTDA